MPNRPQLRWQRRPAGSRRWASGLALTLNLLAGVAAVGAGPAGAADRSEVDPAGVDLASAESLPPAGVDPAGAESAQPASVDPASAGSAPPLVQALAELDPRGEGRLRFLGLRIYDARLWTAADFQAERYAEHRLALQLTYHRAFRGEAIAARSIEEIRRQRPLSAAEAERWRQALAERLPDVQAGDRLTGLYRPGQGMQLWHGERPLGGIDDTELARLFFGIWLSPQSSEPALRDALLAGREAP